MSFPECFRLHSLDLYGVVKTETIGIFIQEFLIDFVLLLIVGVPSIKLIINHPYYEIYKSKIILIIRLEYDARVY